MRTLNNENKIARAVGAEENISTGEKTMRNSSKKTPWHLRFGEKMKTAAAAVVVGIALLVGSTGEVQAACDPPVYDVCFHKDGGDWTTSGLARLFLYFDVPWGKTSQLYEVQWNGLKRIQDSRGRWIYTYDNVSQQGFSGNLTIFLSYYNFWWDPSNPWNNYGCSIYEGHWDGNEWVRGTQVAQVDFYAYQEAALVYLNTSAVPFSLSQYYFTVDWHPNILSSYLLHGYTEGYWERSSGRWRYHGDPGSPRFHFRSRCSVTIPPPPRTPANTRPR